MSHLPWLSSSTIDFPPTSHALKDPNGLLAAGGDLSPERLITAYQRGIFPWYDETQPILWWSPSPRLILIPAELHVSKSMAKLLRKSAFRVTTDTAFAQVVNACAQPREQQDGTWITEDIVNAYCQLHQLGYAHSVEVWEGQTLVGGLYGVALGKVFFGESMFSRTSNASKYGFITLIKALEKLDFRLIDCQVHTGHLASLGAKEIDRETFENYLLHYISNHTSDNISSICDNVSNTALRAQWPTALGTSFA
ncbi:leucyl/phenylalanyl-tRNA--protein transferase [Aestuariicella hydrocarbonica]|uniref:Leucyl/phenylalanyl-tRNA--protein transferase n=1 Tax=Pseudomaricurvus hydrocarbonicus TaxID=1470433 RepID=A0A9E5JUT6_9GAMM|nr:leucyl/phenylalanyl-tRNA--protein transferase [Aestuariicella hydrocarbonica]NHO65290.1 leucyl/phenylalanyl-tRNA--protein transferase [Aestuariicella hydrocarbonica]